MGLSRELAAASRWDIKGRCVSDASQRHVTHGLLGRLPLSCDTFAAKVNDAIMRIGTVPTSAANLQGGDARQPKRSAANVAAFER